MDIKGFFNSKRVLDTAVLMAGGQGTRLREVTGPLPKAMVNIRGTGAQNNGKAKDTILEHQIKLLAENGITNYVLVVGNKREYIQKRVSLHMEDNHYLNVKLKKRVEKEFITILFLNRLCLLNPVQ